MGEPNIGTKNDDVRQICIHNASFCLFSVSEAFQ